MMYRSSVRFFLIVFVMIFLSPLGISNGIVNASQKTTAKTSPSLSDNSFNKSENHHENNRSNKNNINSNITNNNINSNQSIPADCRILTAIPGNRTDQIFCGINKIWTMRIPRAVGLVITILLIFLAGVVTLYVIYFHCKILKDAKWIASKREYICQLPALGTILYDWIDVGADFYIAYRLENGKALEENLHPNPYVINAIFAFACLGAFKILFWIVIKRSFARAIKIEDDETSLLYAKNIMFVVTFAIEDGIEIFLEYFYVEKFAVNQSASFLLSRDIFLVLLSVYTIIKGCCSVSMQKLKLYKTWTYVCLSIVGISVLSLFRLGGAAWQYFTGKLKRSCLKVNSGKLIQTPFNASCLIWIDYCILSLLLLNYVFIAFFTIRKVLSCINPNRDDTDQSVEMLET